MKALKIPLPASVLDMAVKKSNEIGVLHQSYRGQAGVAIGCIGEMVVERWLTNNGVSFSNETNKTTHDYVVNGKRVEVKTKARTVPPKPEYEVTISSGSIDHQDAYYYIFLSLHGDKGAVLPHTAYIVGGSTREYYKNNCIHRKGGELQSNGMTMKGDCLNMYMSNLETPEELISTLKKLQERQNEPKTTQ